MNTNTIALSYLTLGVDDFRVMHHFYQALGFQQYKYSNNPQHSYSMFHVGSVILALYPRALLAKQAKCSLEGRNQALSLSLNVKQATMVDDYLQLAKQHNGVITRQPFEPAWGGYCGYFQDPEMNLWEVVWNERYVFDVAS